MKTQIIPLTRRILEEMGETDDYQNSLRLNGIAFALLADGIPVAAGGIARLWGSPPRACGKAWTLQTESARSSRFLMRRIHRHVKNEFPVIRAAMGLERIEAETLADRGHCAWLERFGFRFEGLMPKYRDGVTYARFGWTS